MTDTSYISAIVLAAGLSARMGQNKLLMQVSGKPMLLRVLELVASVGFGETIVVTSEATLAGLQIPPHFLTLMNENPEKGLSSSLKIGVGAASLDYYMFFPADMPLLDRSAVLRVISGIEDGKIVVPVAGGVPLNPVIFPNIYRAELMRVTGDRGGRAVIAAHPNDCKTVPFENPDMFMDVDTPEDYRFFLK